METRAAFEAALTYLNGIPLSTPDIHAALQAAGLAWLRLVAASNGVVALETVAAESEQLLQLFEQLSEHYERSMQMLLG